MLRTVKILEFNLISTFLLDNNRTQGISFSESGSCDCKPDIHFGEISNLLWKHQCRIKDSIESNKQFSKTKAPNERQKNNIRSNPDKKVDFMYQCFWCYSNLTINAIALTCNFGSQMTFPFFLHKIFLTILPTGTRNRRISIK